jgi:ATP-dependent DNA ligase
MSRTSTLPRRLQPMLATLTDAAFDDPDWVFEDKYDGFRMVAEIRRGASRSTAATERSSATPISRSPRPSKASKATP